MFELCVFEPEIEKNMNASMKACFVSIKLAASISNRVFMTHLLPLNSDLDSVLELTR